MFTFQSLRAKLILLNVGLIAFMTAGASYLLWKAIQEEKKILLDSLIERARGLSDDVQDQFFERYGDVKAFAAALAAEPKMSKEVRTSLINQYVSLYGIYDLIVFVDPNGKFIAANTIDPAGKPLDLASLNAFNFGATPWFEAARTGAFNEDTAKGFTGVALEDPHFDPMVESVYRKPSFGNSFTTAVTTQSGEILGYLTTRAGFRWVEDSFKRSYLELKDNGYVTAGYLLYSSDGRVFTNYIPEQNGNITEIKHEKSVMQNLRLSDFKELEMSGIFPGKTGQSHYFEKGTGHKRLIAFKPIKGKKFIDNYWNVATHFDENEAFVDLNALVSAFIWMLGASSGIALAMGLVFGHRLSNTLKRLVDRLFAQGVEVRAASEEVSATSDNLSSASSQQAAALQQTVAAVNEISAMVSRTADMASQSRNTTQNSRNVAGDGKRTVDEMIQSMDQIRESNNDILIQVEDGNKEISQIVRVISEIGNKTKVINDIVFQTKLLSFNASVEAARAGEHGKGFAVVAEEVGNLAQMSGSAAKEISDLLEQSVVKVQNIVDQTGQRVEKLIVEAREKVAIGADTAKRCANILEQILLNADEVNSLVGEIATSASEQARGVQEINSAMAELDNVTQQNSAAAAQSSQLSGSLLVQSESLSELVAALNTVVSGPSASGMLSQGEQKILHQKNTPERDLASKETLQVLAQAAARKLTRSKQSREASKKILASAPHQSVGFKTSGHNSQKYNRSSGFNGNAALKESDVPSSSDPRFED